MHRIESAWVEAEVDPLAARLWRPRFRLADGGLFEPLAVAPWAIDGAEADDARIPGHLRRLGGAFFCLPFGGTPLREPAEGWPATALVGDAGELHGPAANDSWTVGDRGADHVTLTLALPEPHPVARVEAAFRCDPAAPAIDWIVTVTARAAADLPMAFHPILALPDRPGLMSPHIEGGFGTGFTYPGASGALDRFAPSRTFASLAQVPGIDGRPVALDRLPLAEPGEMLIELARPAGPIRIDRHDLGARLVIDWDRTRLPHCLLWLSDRSIADPPWNGRFRGLGIEPCAAAFDLPVAVSTGDNPIARTGAPTSVRVTPGAPTRLWCRLAAERLSESR
jgi:hypothetical protein